MRMKTENKITVRTKSCGGRRVEKMPLVEMKDTLDNGGRVTLLIRHAERPPLDPGDLTPTFHVRLDGELFSLRNAA